KRPKYTRSKTGCLTCRVKKKKCDEAKPNCRRSTHGERQCTWPDGAPQRKRAPSVKQIPDGIVGPSTVTTLPHISESESASSTSGLQRSPVELNLPPRLAPRRQ
ncbi:hypothetical protein DFH06DRAFT_990185, partial [Mycena polygramma]